MKLKEFGGSLPGFLVLAATIVDSMATARPINVRPSPIQMAVSLARRFARKRAGRMPG